MIPLPECRKIEWQSPDGLMEAGQAQAGERNFLYASLGQRPVEWADVEGLIGFLENQLRNPKTPLPPLALLSACPGFAVSPQSEGQGLVFMVGRYRSLQQRYKLAGGLILSYIYDIAVGGTYLMHGLSAHARAAAPDVCFHDTVLSRPTVPLEQVQAYGLIDALVPPANAWEWLAGRSEYQARQPLLPSWE